MKDYRFVFVAVVCLFIAMVVMGIEYGNQEIYFTGDATVWDDVKIDGIRVTFFGSPPAWRTIIGSVGAYGYAPGEQSWFSIQMPHRIVEDSSIESHVHCGPDGTDGDGGNARFSMECAWSDINDAFDAAATLTGSDQAMGTGADNHFIHGIGTWTNATHGVNDTVSTVGLCRLERTAADADEYTGEVFVYSIDFHIEMDKLGSRTETAW